MGDHALRPAYKNSFHPAVAKEMIKQVLVAKLKDKTYNPEITSQWSRDIADEIKMKLKELHLPRYKYVVNVAIGEQRGEGIRIGCRCFWDSDVDSCAQETFMNVRPRRAPRGRRGAGFSVITRSAPTCSPAAAPRGPRTCPVLTFSLPYCLDACACACVGFALLFGHRLWRLPLLGRTLSAFHLRLSTPPSSHILHSERGRGATALALASRRRAVFYFAPQREWASPRRR
jgi:hypothetical protein